ncbi:MAG TPA: hypothetical protein VIG41_00195 [Micrococcaceae bacterium]
MGAAEGAGLEAGAPGAGVVPALAGGAGLVGAADPGDADGDPGGEADIEDVPEEPEPALPLGAACGLAEQAASARAAEAAKTNPK